MRAPAALIVVVLSSGWAASDSARSIGSRADPNGIEQQRHQAGQPAADNRDAGRAALLVIAALPTGKCRSTTFLLERRGQCRRTDRRGTRRPSCGHITVASPMITDAVRSISHFSASSRIMPGAGLRRGDGALSSALVASGWLAQRRYR